MDSYWDGRGIVWDNLSKRSALSTPIFTPITVPSKRVIKGALPIKIKGQARLKQPKSNAPLGWEMRDLLEQGEALAIQFSENRKATASLQRAFGWALAARPKPGKDGSIRKASEKIAIAAWRQARVMGKPSAGTARMDFLDLDLAARRQVRREMLGRIRIG